MESKGKIVSTSIVLGILCLCAVSVKADERIGNLVFNAMKQIQENHENFTEEVSVIRHQRENAIEERERAKEQFQHSGSNTLDGKEHHAEFCYAQARVYKALYKEAKVTNAVARKQLHILNKLKDVIGNEASRMSHTATMRIVETSKPFLENGRSLLTSLAQYRDKITDPVINSKLNSAYATACMLSSYLESIDANKLNRHSTHEVLLQKVNGLVDQLNTLYVQSDIFMDMIRDKATVLKMINQVAASEMAVLALSNGSKSIERLASSVMDPLLEECAASDENMDILAQGVANTDLDSFDNQGTYSQRWVNSRF